MCLMSHAEAPMRPCLRIEGNIGRPTFRWKWGRNSRLRRSREKRNMESLRLAPLESVFPRLACCRCLDSTRPWDRIAGKTFCPNCLERLAEGDGDPLVERTDKRRCAVCQHQGTIRYLTFPLHSRRPVEVDLCSEHLRALVPRRLGPHAFEQLRRQIEKVGLHTGHIFMLHEAFYDTDGRAIQPIAG